jgi:hypothetical protein
MGHPNSPRPQERPRQRGAGIQGADADGGETAERQTQPPLGGGWTLMGLPIGWTMPSCIRPVTIAQTSCDSLGMALCQPSQSERSDFLLASCGKEPTK